MDAVTTELIARAVIRDSGRRLLVARERGKKWVFLPGGHVEPGEPIEAALIREIGEELGVGATVVGLIGTVEHGYIDDRRTTHHEINLVFETELLGEPSSQEPHLEFTWLATDRIAVTDLRPGPLKDILDEDMKSVWRSWAGLGNRSDSE